MIKLRKLDDGAIQRTGECVHSDTGKNVLLYLIYTQFHFLNSWKTQLQFSLNWYRTAPKFSFEQLTPTAQTLALDYWTTLTELDGSLPKYNKLEFL